jgi:orotidine-5'-phosphate decarboxylase
MMRQCVKSAKTTAKELGQKEPFILGVTILTSISDEVLQNELEIDQKASDYVLKLAKLAKESGLDGVVASTFEAKKIKEICGENFKVLCPGIRPEWSLKNDQKRAATPKVALQEGADYLVIGRAVTAADDKLKAMQMIYEEMN